MKKLLSLITLVALLTFVSCGKPNDPKQIGPESLTAKQNQFITELENAKGFITPVVVKTDTEQGGEWIVVKNYSHGDGLFRPVYSDQIAYNLSYYKEGEIGTFLDHGLYRGNGTGTPNDEYGMYVENSGNNNYVVEYWTGTEGPPLEVTFEEASSEIKDLEKLGNQIQEKKVQELINNLSAYGLSDERAASVAKITYSFKKIQNKRSLSDKEMNIYTQKVLGVDYTAGKKALEKHIQGDSADMEAMMERAADMNGTSPEAVTELMGEYLLK